MCKDELSTWHDSVFWGVNSETTIIINIRISNLNYAVSMRYNQY